MMRPTLIVAASVFLFLGPQLCLAKNTLTITHPKHSQLTPVQRLNREGVEAIKRHNIPRATSLFYKAYLYDPGDPFTLNNLGYISELQGELERAHRFYTLAEQQGSNASIARSSTRQLEGRPMQDAFQTLRDGPMQINRMNVNAMSLLSEDRGFEAVALLSEALSLDKLNPFTLNNLGVAHEAIGDYDSALNDYNAAASRHSSEPVVVTQNGSWRGKPVSTMAAASGKRLEERIRKMDPEKGPALLLTVRGVSATNRNEWLVARQDFLRAYLLDPVTAFSLNNRGFVAEKDGDLETAQFFYAKARDAIDSRTRVGLATLRSAEGKSLHTVAAQSHQQVGEALDKYSLNRRNQAGPIELISRDDTLGGKSPRPDETSPPTDLLLLEAEPSAPPQPQQLQGGPK